MSKKIKSLLIILGIIISISIPNKDNFALKANSENQTIKIKISENGIYKIAFQNLNELGFSTADLTNENIKLENAGIKTPVLIQDKSIIFYGEKPNSNYTNKNIYILEKVKNGETESPAITNSEIIPPSTNISESSIETIHFEKNTTYNNNLRNGKGRDHFFWAYLNAPQIFKYEFPLDEINYSNPNSKLNLKTIRIDSAATPAYFDVYLNGEPIKENALEGMPHQNNLTEILFNTNVLKTENLLEIKLKTTNNRIYLNNFDLQYSKNITVNTTLQKHFNFNAQNETGFKITAKPTLTDVEIFEITTEKEIKKINQESIMISPDNIIFTSNNNIERVYYVIFDNNYLIPENISITTNYNLGNNHAGADYIILTHPYFLELNNNNQLITNSDISRLKEHRQNNDNFTVNIYSTDEIYDNYNFGIKDPAAIKNFLYDAYTNWQIKPKYLLIIGNTTFDPLNYLNTTAEDFIPTLYNYLAHETEKTEYETPDDELLSDFISEDNNVTGEIITGRLPITSKEQLHNIVEKIFTYESDVYAQNIKKSVFNVTSPASYLELLEPAILDSLPEDYNYYVNNPEMFNNSINLARNDFIQKLNEGQMITTYIGHGQVDSWNGNFYKNSYLEKGHSYNLNNTQFPIIASLSCFGGLYNKTSAIVPTIIDSIAEKFLISPNGSIASFGFQGTTYPNEVEQFTRNLYSTIYTEKPKRLGDVIQKIRKSFTIQSMPSTNLAYFGDPALNLKAFYPETFAKPSWNSILQDQTVNIGDELNITLSASDNYANPITYYAENIPNNANLNPQTGQFTWKPDINQINEKYQTIFKAWNGYNEISQNIILSVSVYNRNKTLFNINLEETGDLNYFNDESEFKNNANCYPGLNQCPKKGIPAISGLGVYFNDIFQLLEIKSNDSLNPEYITVITRINPDATNENRYQLVVTKKLHFELSINPARKRFRTGIITSDGVRTYFDNYNVLEPGQWSTLALTYDGKEVKAYVNGTLVGSREKEGKMKVNNFPITIGGYYGGSFGFIGQMDDVKIYNYAMTQEEIAEF